MTVTEDAENLRFLVCSLPHRECLDISLVLASQSIGHWIIRSASGQWEIHANSEEQENITETLRKYRDENPQLTQVLPSLHLRWQPLWVLTIPAFFSFFAHFSHKNLVHSLGIAESGRILSGEWWRLFTALTLHADARHLASNLVAGYFILNLLAGRVALSRILPWLVAAAGTANLFVALSVQPNFRSLGFSTLVFASLGCLSAVETRLLPSGSSLGNLRKLQPLWAAFFVAIMMGLGENSDILAHFYGFLCGVACGFILPKHNFIHNWISLAWLRALGAYWFFAFCWGMASKFNF